MKAGRFTALLKAHPTCSVCVALSIVLALAIYFRGGRVAELQAAYEQNSTEGQRILANRTNAVQLPEQLAALKQAVGAAQARLVHRDELATNLQYFYRLESDTGTKFVNLSQNSGPAGPKGRGEGAYAPLGFSVGVQGTFAQVLDFLRRLDRGPYFCRIESATCSPAGGESGQSSGQLTLSLSLQLLGEP